MMRHRVDGVVVVLLLLATAVRFPTLGARSLWFDEALSGLIARLSTTQVLSNAAGSSHPPGYYFVLHLWRPLGESEFALRFPSAWCSLAAVALVARLGRDLSGQRTARLAALGMALSPFQIYYAQETRMYGLTIALSAGVLWAFLRGACENNRKAWCAYGVLTGLGLYVHYYIALAVLALHLWLFLDRGRARRVGVSVAVADSLAAVAFLPQVTQLLTEAGESLRGLTSWQPRPTLLSPLTTLYYLLFGHVLPLGWVGIGLFLTLAVTALAGLALARQDRGAVVWPITLVVIVPLLLILALSFIAHSIYLERSFAVATPALMLLLAWAVANAPRRSPAPYLGAALAALMAVGAVLYHLRPDPAKPPLHEAVEVVAEGAETEDIRLHLQDASYLPALYYESERAGALVDVGQRLWLAPEVYTLFGGRVVTAATLPTSGRVWLTVMPGYVGPAQAELLARWDAAHAPLETWDWETVQTRLYALEGE
ncbi:MAG TPA: hypothetical protein ENI37_08195 [Chloroflexi bacterium]|nr:hypothetical protein [Chloroflexota bacterium]